MFYWIKLSLHRQLVAMAAALSVGGAALYFWNYSPLVRSNSRLASVAALGLTLNIFFAAIFVAAGLYFPRTGLQSTLRDVRELSLRSGPAALVGAAIFAAAGEEYLLRGLLFGSLMDTMPIVGAATTIALSAAGYWRGKKSWFWSLLHGLEGAWYVMIYYRHHSLACLVFIRLARELAGTQLLISPRTEKILTASKFQWREMYEQLRSPQRALRRV